MSEPTAKMLRLAAVLCACAVPGLAQDAAARPAAAASSAHGLVVTVEMPDGTQVGPTLVLEFGGLSEPDVRSQGRVAGSAPAADESRLELTLAPTSAVGRQLAGGALDTRHPAPRVTLVISASGHGAPRPQFEFDACRVIATETKMTRRGTTTRFSLACARMVRR